MNTCEGLWGCLAALFSMYSKDFLIAAIGSFFGAWGAWMIGDVAKKREDYKRDIRAINTASALSFTISNEFMTLKKQHLRNMKEEYEELRNNFLLAWELKERGLRHPEDPIVYEPNLMQLDSPATPIKLLESHLLEKVSLGGRTIGLLNYVASSVDSFNASCQRRNDVIQRGMQDGLHMEPTLYFGLPIEKGVDLTYKSNFEGMMLYCDDVIYFASELSLALMTQGKELEKKTFRFYRRGAPDPAEGNFDIAIEGGLMPDPASYKEWERGFISRPQKVGCLAQVSAAWQALADKCKPPTI